MIIEEQKKKIKIIMKNVLRKISFNGTLSAFSFIFIIFILIIYIAGNLFDIVPLKNIFVDAWGSGFIWFTIIFVILCNFDHVREIVKSSVREKMDSLVISDIREEIIHKIENDPEMLRKLKDAKDKKAKRSFINKPINPK